MAKKCDHSFLTHHSGTEQSERLKASLLPENFNLNDFSIAQWMEFAYKFAKEVNYFDITSDTNPLGNWETFFIEENNIATFVSKIETGDNLTPHLTLFVVFLKLLETSKERFNKITERHLDFYYQEILQIDKKSPLEDQVHLIFELAKNTTQAQIQKSTFVEAGKDTSGKKMQYSTNDELVANKAKIAALKSIYHHRKSVSNETNGLFAASIVNSLDGNGEPFKDDTAWLPFGYPDFHNPEQPLGTPTVGFAVAAPTLALQEGERLVKITYQLDKKVQSIPISSITSSIDVYATGEKGWLGPFQISENISPDFTSSISEKKVQLSVLIDKTQEAIVSYNSEIHGDQYKTKLPLFKFELKTTQPLHTKGYTFYTELLEKKLKSVTINVEVNGITSLQLKNDLGDIASDKPFFPFGTQPVKRSAFYMDYNEVFQKEWKKITIKATWLNTPDNFKDHYFAYRRDENNKNLTPQLYYQTLYHNYDPEKKTYTLNKAAGVIQKATSNHKNLYVTGNGYFTSKVGVIDKEILKTLPANLTLFTDSNNDKVFEMNLSINNTEYTTGKNGPIKLSLNHSFLHSLFPRVYALSLTNSNDTILPNEPYTPIVEVMSMDYTANQQVTFGENGNVTENMDEIELFHLHPFGQSKTKDTMVPTYCKGGELYIGLEQTEALQTVSILFQLLEGTENPLAKPFSNTEKIIWSILSNDSWQNLDSSQLLGDTTDNFLKTGIVSITIPREANSDNSMLPLGYVWLRAKSNKSFDAVCKLIDVQAQVIPATFVNQQNELSHLIKGLPANTISKLTQRAALVKKVSQPYNSFSGQPEETSNSYYKRVSERIRHRDRAVNQWDYEHLILEQFKDIYKVKCLNHTKGSNYHAPGNVSLIVIPDIVNNNAFDIYQPRVSTAKRNEIDAYINNLNTYFVTAEIVNPDYEEIEITTGVKFHKGYDENFYTSQLEETIKKYLSPWAFEETNGINFGVAFHRSKIIEYLEQLEYVDFLQDFVVKHRPNAQTKYSEKVNVLPTSPKAILVSAKKHNVTAVQSKCGKPIPKTKTICLP
ncbi:MAG: baseplate J/gp47 family protein [Flavobacteriaceae bacterium]|nr:baseplate J/gp47 family protein [Flavobacteriaceae bacterium]